MQTAATLRGRWNDEGQIALQCVFAVLPLLARRHRVDEAVALADELVTELGRLWLDEWFLARIELSARVLAALTEASRVAGEARRRDLIATGARFHRDAGLTRERGLPPGRTLGPGGPGLGRPRGGGVGPAALDSRDRPAAAARNSSGSGGPPRTPPTTTRTWSSWPGCARRWPGCCARWATPRARSRRRPLARPVAPRHRRRRDPRRVWRPRPTGARTGRPACALPLTPSRARGAGADRERALEPPDRPAPLHQREDRQRARLEHPGQARASAAAPRPPPSPAATACWTASSVRGPTRNPRWARSGRRRPRPRAAAGESITCGAWRP